MSQLNGPVRVNAATFQEPLARLADTLVQKVFRDWAGGNTPRFPTELMRRSLERSGTFL
jgi:hypothetical protein